MQSKTKTAFGAIDGITNIIKQVNEVATTIAGAVEEQQAAIQEIARNIVSGTEFGDGIMGKTVETSSVYGLSFQLGEQSKKLEAHVEEFVTKVRAT
jgi:methyl-accepting chemotaxis protein